ARAPLACYPRPLTACAALIIGISPQRLSIRLTSAVFFFKNRAAHVVDHLPCEKYSGVIPRAKSSADDARLRFSSVRPTFGDCNGAKERQRTGPRPMAGELRLGPGSHSACLGQRLLVVHSRTGLYPGRARRPQGN